VTTHYSPERVRPYRMLRIYVRRDSKSSKGK